MKQTCGYDLPSGLKLPTLTYLGNVVSKRQKLVIAATLVFLNPKTSLL